MATGSQIGGPQSYSFMPCGNTLCFTVAANSITTTLSLFTTQLPPAPDAAFTVLGAASPNNTLFVTFESATVSSASAMPIPSILSYKGLSLPFDVLRTGVRPRAVVQIMSPGTCTVFITPGEGSR